MVTDHQSRGGSTLWKTLPTALPSLGKPAEDRSLVFHWQLAFAREASDVGKGNPATNLFLPTASVKPPQNPASKGKYEPYRDAFGLL